jgi:hypothetical protein
MLLIGAPSANHLAERAVRAALPAKIVRNRFHVNEVGASVGGEELKPGAIVFRENAQPDFTRGERLSSRMCQPTPLIAPRVAVLEKTPPHLRRTPEATA